MRGRSAKTPQKKGALLKEGSKEGSKEEITRRLRFTHIFFFLSSFVLRRREIKGAEGEEGTRSSQDGDSSCINAARKNDKERAPIMDMSIRKHPRDHCDVRMFPSLFVMHTIGGIHERDKCTCQHVVVVVCYPGTTHKEARIVKDHNSQGTPFQGQTSDKGISQKG